jgi:hypothetical protein
MIPSARCEHYQGSILTRNHTGNMGWRSPRVFWRRGCMRVMLLVPSILEDTL